MKVPLRLLSAGLALGLAACGNKSALVLPPGPPTPPLLGGPAATPAPKPVPTAPAPAPVPPRRDDGSTPERP